MEPPTPRRSRSLHEASRHTSFGDGEATSTPAAPGPPSAAASTATLRTIDDSRRTNDSPLSFGIPPSDGRRVSLPVPAHIRAPRTENMPLQAPDFLQLLNAQSQVPVGPPAQPDAEHGEHQQPATHGTPPMALITRWLAFFGRGSAGTRARRAFVSMIATLSLGTVEFVVILTVLSYGATRKSPTTPDQNEWDACNKPLGVWDILWLLRTTLVCYLSIWTWKLRRDAPPRQTTTDAEPGTATGTYGVPTSPTSPRRPRNEPTAAVIAERPSDTPSPRHRGRNNRILAPPLYTRLSLLSTLFNLTWFITAHILVFTSVYTCRFDAPHLWWLTFAIICLTYAAIFEIFIIALVIFIVGPIIFVLLNILLLCLGRHPLQNPQAIKPAIGKLSKSVVERIPLVLYIPAPPEDEGGADSGTPTVPTPVHAYPPVPTKPKKKKRRFRFALLSRRRGAKGGTGRSNGDDKDSEPETWEDNWLPAALPFVRLAGNRAACAICLMDFEEPPRARNARLPPLGAAPASDAPSREPETHVPVERVDDTEPHLADAGEGAQPLRLLHCGHAFHKTCVDPWLTDVSGRCPVCQRPVEVAPQPQRKRWWQRRGSSAASQPNTGGQSESPV